MSYQKLSSMLNRLLTFCVQHKMVNKTLEHYFAAYEHLSLVIAIDKIALTSTNNM